MPDPDEMIRTALAFHQAGKLDEAEAIYTRVLRLRSDHADALHLKGLIAHQRGRVADAIDFVGRAVRARPGEAGFRFNYGNVLAAGGRDAEAARSFSAAIGLQPDFLDALRNLANVLERLKQDSDLIEVLRKIVALRPADSEARLRLGRHLHRLEQLGPAIAEYQEAIRLSPNQTGAYGDLAAALQAQGRGAEALGIFRKLIPSDGPAGPEISPGVHSNLMMAMQYNDSVASSEIFDAHRRWAQIHAVVADSSPPPKSRAEPDRIRVGYVSADFWNHPVGHFIRPLIERHDRSRFDVICYDHSDRDDGVTRLLKASAEQWRAARGTSDAQLAAMVREDCIDVLVDLSGHTAGHRLTAFALRPAPVQVTYLGYPGTTGMTAIDYRLTDADADPPGMTDRFYTEKLVRLPHCLLCFTPPEAAPAVAPLPADSAGVVTFGSFNAAAKVSPTTVRLWASVLHAVPRSRLVLKSVGWADAANRQRLIGAFAGHGINGARLEFLSFEQTWSGHLDRYGRIDLALDTFPYHGTATTCDALWMGVPTVTLAGQTHVSRVGATLMKHAGLPEFIADDERHFVEIASASAGNLPRLRDLRRSMRDRLRASVLCDAATFTSDVERAIEAMVAVRP
jgi:protein O-GlcNAc transferase